MELMEAAKKMLGRNANSPNQAKKPFVKLLQQHGDLLETLAFDYLTRVAAGSGDKPTSVKPVANMADIAARNAAINKKYRERTNEQRAGAVSAAKSVVSAIYESRKIGGIYIGDVRWNQLKAIARDEAEISASSLQVGFDAAYNALLAGKIFGYAKVDDPDTKTRNVVPPAALEKMMKETYTDTAKLIERTAAYHTNRILQQEIA